MADLITQLRRTSTAAWTESAFGARSLNADPADGERAKPRPLFCRAVVRHLDEMDADVDFARVRIRRRDLNHRTGHQGEGTLYATFGRQAPQSLEGRLGEWMDKAFGERDVVGHLIAETKAWSYRPHRTGWLAELTDEQTRLDAAETLVKVLADWAARNQRLAKVHDHAPPATAVEDLCVISGDHVSPDDAKELLAKAVRTAVSAEGAAPSAALNVVQGALITRLAEKPSGYCDELVRAAEKTLEQLHYMWPHLDKDEKKRAAQRLDSRMSDLQRLMDKEERAVEDGKSHERGA